MGRWISCPARSKVDCLITLLFHCCGTITTNAFFMIFCTSHQKKKKVVKKREKGGRYKLIVCWWNQSSSSPAVLGLMGLKAAGGSARETGGKTREIGLHPWEWNWCDLHGAAAVVVAATLWCWLLGGFLVWCFFCCSFVFFFFKLEMGEQNKSLAGILGHYKHGW